MTFHEEPPSSRWIRHTRARYVSMYGLQIIEIERVGARWHTTISNPVTGEVLQLETRSPLSVAIQQAETAAAQAAQKKEQ